RLGRGGAELANRSTEFSYFGVAYLLALCATQTLGWAARARGALRWPGGIGASLAAAALVFLGGFELGWAPVALQPGPYLPGANSRSITEQGTSAAVWAGRFLPSGSRLFTHMRTAFQVGSYALLPPQTRS